jgi:hypothetical protein
MATHNTRESELLFGTKLQPVSIVVLSKQTKIPESTLRLYKRNPGTIPLDRLRIIVKALGLSEDDVNKLIRGK